LRFCHTKIETGVIARSTAVLIAAVFAAHLAVAQTDPQKRPATPTKNCTAGGCHSNVTGSPNPHGPLKVGGCSGCHGYKDTAKHLFQAARQGNNLCLFCHKLEAGAYLHQPMKDKTCIECHAPHGGETNKHLRAKSTEALCEKCHAKTIRGKVRHKPVADGGCIGCHSPHASSQPKLLRRESGKVCLDCHVVFADRLKQAKSIHKPMEKGCLECHNPHAANLPKLLGKPVRDLCFSCHDDIRFTVEHAKIQHGALAEMRECLNCHDAHTTRFAELLRNNTRAVCLKCHDKELATSKGKIRDMSKVISEGKTLHGPITINDCSKCHQIHGGDLFDLLRKQYPSEFYSSFREENYALCFSCHDPRLALVSQTTRVTGFRNGDKNLHALHVNQESKGRTCRACHEIHSIGKDKYIRDSVPFGDWIFQTGYTKTATGGSCTPGCHQHYSYDRRNPVKYETSEKNSTGRDPGEKKKANRDSNRDASDKK
jgi:predicted CXXCH cytochrome family protein